jgi:RHH-type proline utilization regulon transcriptional repressor/proline dehydrogenase/delta 1-pyrroline-5-carboxylate dehydrogenase
VTLQDDLAAARRRMAEFYLGDEAQLAERLIFRARLTPEQLTQTDALARRLVDGIRSDRHRTGLEAFLAEYRLSTQEGVVLMCLAEALLRVPDAATADRLIRDKLEAGDWQKHLGASPSLFVNASTWGLMLTGRIVELGERTDWAAVLGRLVARGGEPLIRQSLIAAIRMLGTQFVFGRTIHEALERGREARWHGCRFSFDMLGEAAMTQADAERYAAKYREAIEAVGRASNPTRDVFANHSVSVKLSALHPRFEANQRARVLAELVPRLLELARDARRYGIGLTLDAEEADRIELMLDVLEALCANPDIAGWNGIGLAVQAYGKRAPAILDWLAALAASTGRRFPVRLVKGAYWDSEIKRAQEQGLTEYPVFTRKAATDTSYLACARRLLAEPRAFVPMFATHNAHTLAAVYALAGGPGDYEFQRLHGMGEELYEIVESDELRLPVRVYAPVGAHEDLLAYLVRRLLENGANTSFVNRLADDETPIGAIVADPVEALAGALPRRNPRIALPTELFPGRRNSVGILLTEPSQSRPLLAAIERELATPLAAAPLVAGGVAGSAAAQPVFAPAERSRRIGTVAAATAAQVESALAAATAAQPAWDALGGAARATILERAADAYEEQLPLLAALCVREAGKTVGTAVADVREAVDFLRYYAACAREQFATPKPLPGPTGERNEISLHGRGVFACISPWNFPVAIFTGQVAAALAAGNTIAAKPAEQTPLTAFAAVRLLHAAGVPTNVLQYLPGDGPEVGGALVRDLRVAGVAFTGSTEVAQLINRQLAARDGPIAALIAETGGQNAMIADSTALPEQLARDVVASAFDSAGQRCSALRVLFVQRDIADRVLELLAGSMAELVVGDPLQLATDVGPVIDGEALATLRAHAERMTREGRLVARAPLAAEVAARGTFFAPHAFEIRSIAQLEREVFGPILHVVRYAADELADVCTAINASRYGLTLGVHSRIDATAEFVRARVRVGNLYVNRNQIGAVVGAQPFGGEGLSGTGPKAGGPHYLQRFAVERVVCTNTTAAGGNASLLAL